MNLALFFTRGVSLKTWVTTGLIDREKQLYEKHLREGALSRVVWFTYGLDDAGLAKKLHREGRLHSSIHVVSMPRCFQGKIGVLLYSVLLPVIRCDAIRKCHILKTNQMDGSWAAVFAKLFWRKPLVVRTGYTISQLLRSTAPFSRLKYLFFIMAEYCAYSNADVACVASWHNKAYVLERYPMLKGRIVVMPNYIDTQLFSPIVQRHEKKKRSIVYVGRLSSEKNLLALVQAVADLDVSLDLYGQGDQASDLRDFAKFCKARVDFKGTIPNSELPDVLKQYHFFVLPSLFEGMPKALLEAMACGLVCLGTDVTGINEVIVDGFNGFLANGTDVSAIRLAIVKAMNSNDRAISINAIRTISSRFSLNEIVALEQTIWKDLSFERNS